MNHVKEKPQSQNCSQIQLKLENTEILHIQLGFIKNFVLVFEEFLLIFHPRRPKVHVIYGELMDIVRGA